MFPMGTTGSLTSRGRAVSSTTDLNDLSVRVSKSLSPAKRRRASVSPTKRLHPPAVEYSLKPVSPPKRMHAAPPALSPAKRYQAIYHDAHPLSPPKHPKPRADPHLWSSPMASLHGHENQVIPVWLTEADAKRREIVAAKELATRKPFLSEKLLDDVMDYMKEEGRQTISNAAMLKWEEILHLHRVISSHAFRGISLAGTPSSLYESFYKAEPRPYCNQARFFTVMRNV